MRTFRASAPILVALLALAFVPAAQAQTIENRPETAAVTGKVSHIDPNARMFTIHEATGADWTFSVRKETSFMNGDKPIEFSALKKGWTVVVNYDANVALKPTGNIALMVQVTDVP